MKRIIPNMRALFSRQTGVQRGFTLLIAVLIASLMLILASSMFNLVQKEIILASIGRDSEYAFYTADSALECALYWDFQKQAFSNPSGGAPIVCDNVTATATSYPGSAQGSIAYPGYDKEMTLQFDSIVGGARYCSRVSVTKNTPNPPSPGTTIQARGYNTSCATLDSNPRALERAVEVNY